MSIRHPKFWLSAALLFAFLLPANLGAQCAVTATNVYSTFPSFISIHKELGATFPCRLTASNNAGFCFPSNTVAPVSVTDLQASAPVPPPPSPSCAWVCNCGPGFTSVAFVTNSADGLPVELMDFSVDGGEPTDEDGTALPGPDHDSADDPLAPSAP